jgi:hypothetical protein
MGNVQYVLTYQGVKSGNDFPMRFSTAMQTEMVLFEDLGPISLEACQQRCTEQTLCKGE